jgi:hypothetical protein
MTTDRPDGLFATITGTTVAILGRHVNRRPPHAGLVRSGGTGNIARTVMQLGHTLRGARRERGSDLTSCAAATGIPVEHLRAMEEERLDRLPRDRATDIVRRYADHLGLDARLLGELVQAELAADPDADTQPIPVVGSPGPPRVATVLWLGAGAVVGLGALVVFGGGLGSGDGPSGATPTTTPPPAHSAPRTARTPPPPQTLRPTPPVRPAIDLRLGARSGKAVWIEVRREGASGESLFAGIVGNGVTRRFTSRTPLWLGVAWAPNATVTLNGEPIDPEGGTQSYLVTAKGLSRLSSP